MLRSEVEQRADFSEIRNAQCWEGADIQLEAPNVRMSMWLTGNFSHLEARLKRLRADCSR